MDYDGGVFLWNIIFKTFKALATELLQLHHGFWGFFFLNFIFPSPPTQLLVCGYSSLRWQEVSLLLDSPVSHQCEKEERLYMALLGHVEAGGVSNRAEEKLCSDSVQK